MRAPEKIPSDPHRRDRCPPGHLPHIHLEKHAAILLKAAIFSILEVSTAATIAGVDAGCTVASN